MDPRKKPESKKYANDFIAPPSPPPALSFQRNQAWDDVLAQSRVWNFSAPPGNHGQSGPSHPPSVPLSMPTTYAHTTIPQQTSSPPSFPPSDAFSATSHLLKSRSMPSAPQSFASADPTMAFAQHSQQPYSPGTQHTTLPSWGSANFNTPVGISSAAYNQPQPVATFSTSLSPQAHPFHQSIHPSMWTNVSMQQSLPDGVDGVAFNPPQHSTSTASEYSTIGSESPKQHGTHITSPHSQHSSIATGVSVSTNSTTNTSQRRLRRVSSVFDDSRSSPSTSTSARKQQAEADLEEARLREAEKDIAMAEFDVGPNRGNKRERRKMQNRLAQKAFRARSKVTAGEEADRVDSLESLSREQGEQIERMRAVLSKLQSENEALREAAHRTANSLGDIHPNPSDFIPSSSDHSRRFPDGTDGELDSSVGQSSNLRQNLMDGFSNSDTPDDSPGWGGAMDP